MGAVLYQLTLFQTQDFRVILVGTIYGKYIGLIIKFLPRGDSVIVLENVVELVLENGTSKCLQLPKDRCVDLHAQFTSRTITCARMFDYLCHVICS